MPYLLTDKEINEFLTVMIHQYESSQLRIRGKNTPVVNSQILTAFSVVIFDKTVSI